MLNCWILDKTSGQAGFFSVTLLYRSGLVWCRILDKTPAQAELFSSNFTVQERVGEEPDIGENLRSS
jgi:hypothetical protein